MFSMQSPLILLNVFRPNLLHIPEARDLRPEGSRDSAQRMEGDRVKDPAQEGDDRQCHKKPGIWKAKNQ
jgi:hypothetical protein